MITRRSFSTILGAAASASGLAAAGKSYLVYFGTYTRKTSKGIYVARLDAETGHLSEPQLAAEVANPSFVAIHPNQKYLYSISEIFEVGGGSVTAYSIDKSSGKLTKLNDVRTKGSGGCHLNLDRSGRSLVVAYYGSGSTASFPVKADGSLGEAASFIQHAGSSKDQKRQQGPHAHSANITRDGRFAIVADLGLDQLLVYKLNPAAATIAPNDPPFVKVAPGSGPRHFTFHPSEKFAYANGEMSSTAIAFTWDGKKGVFQEIQTLSTLPEGFTGNNSTAETVIHPNGKFLYVSNRGHNSLAVYSIDGSGRMKRLDNVSTQGKIPRNFAIDPTGKWMLAANQDSENVVVFAVDPNNGKLTPTGQQLKVDSCVCVRYVTL